jgi:hypothetical protein
MKDAVDVDLLLAHLPHLPPQWIRVSFSILTSPLSQLALRQPLPIMLNKS